MSDGSPMPFPGDAPNDPPDPSSSDGGEKKPAISIPAHPDSGVSERAPEPAAPPAAVGAEAASADDDLIPPEFKNATAHEEPRKTFWVGTLPDCPKWNLDLGGISFPRMTEKVTGPNATDRQPEAGTKIELTPTQVKRVKDAIRSRVFRMRANGTGDLIITNDPRRPYTKSPHDRPCAEFVYMQAVEAAPREFAYPDPLATA